MVFLIALSLLGPHQGQETIFKLHLRSELPKEISICYENCHKTITQSDLGMDPSTSISGITTLKYMTVKGIMCLMNSLITNKLR